MNILFISQFFPPEGGAAANRAFAHSKYWVKFGNKVTALCETPCYMIDEAKRDNTKKCIVEKINGIDCVRIPVFWASNRSSVKRRLLNQISFMFGAIRYGKKLLKEQRFDIVIASSPPLFAGIAGKRLARKANARFIFEVRDLWPESIVAMGKMSDKNPIVVIAKRVAKSLYKHADVLVTVTKGLKKKLENRILGKEVTLIYNGADMSDISNGSSGVEKGLLVYSGILGYFQGIDVIIRAIPYMKHKAIKCIIIGDGKKKNKLMEKARDLKLGKRLVFVGSVSHREAIEYVKRADICLVSMIDSPITNEALPSKVFEYAACGKPVAASLAGEMAKMIREYNIGLVSEPEDPEAFAKILDKMLKDEKMKKEFSENARHFAELFSRERMAKEYLDLMESLLSKKTQEHRTNDYVIK